MSNILEQKEYAIGWGTLALINAGLAQSKGKSGLFWFLVSLLIGPFATFLLVVIRDRGDLTPAERERVIKEMKKVVDQTAGPQAQLPKISDALKLD